MFPLAADLIKHWYGSEKMKREDYCLMALWALHALICQNTRAPKDQGRTSQVQIVAVPVGKQ